MKNDNTPTSTTAETPPTAPPTAPPVEPSITTTGSSPLVALDPADLACRDCGIVVPGPIERANVTFAEATAAEIQNGIIRPTGTLSPVPLTTCTNCSDRRALAADLAARQPHGVDFQGIRYINEQAAGVILGALVALDILGRPRLDPDRLQARELASMVTNLSPGSGALAWSIQFAPVRRRDARIGMANAEPWGHVSEDSRAVLRRAYADVLAERLAAAAPPVNLAPPVVDRGDVVSGTLVVKDGCLLCGVASISMPALRVNRAGGTEHAARDVWTFRTGISPNSLGGRRAPARVAGHTCPTCSQVLADVGASGPTAIERALLVHLGLGSRWNEALRLSRVPAYGGLVANVAALDESERAARMPAPNPTPWAHLGDLDALRERLSQTLGAMAGGARHGGSA